MKDGTNVPGACVRQGHNCRQGKLYLYLLRLFLPCSFLFRHGSSGGGTCRVARNPLPSKRDARERRELVFWLPSDFLRIIVSFPFEVGKHDASANVVQLRDKNDAERRGFVEDARCFERSHRTFHIERFIRQNRF